LHRFTKNYFVDDSLRFRKEGKIKIKPEKMSKKNLFFLSQ